MTQSSQPDRAPLPSAVETALHSLIEDAAQRRATVFAADAIQRLRAGAPDGSLNSAELVEALLRAAAARGVSVSVTGAG